MFKPSRQAIVDFLQEEDGPTAVEYAVMLAMIIAVCIVSVQALSGHTTKSFQDTGNALSGAFN